MENTDATVTVANTKLTRAVVLDANGMATSAPVDTKRAEGKITIVLPANAMYVVLQ